jgi:hypothetical protein
MSLLLPQTEVTPNLGYSFLTSADLELSHESTAPFDCNNSFFGFDSLPSSTPDTQFFTAVSHSRSGDDGGQKSSFWRFLPFSRAAGCTATSAISFNGRRSILRRLEFLEPDSIAAGVSPSPTTPQQIPAIQIHQSYQSNDEVPQFPEPQSQSVRLKFIAIIASMNKTGGLKERPLGKFSRTL